MFINKILYNLNYKMGKKRHFSDVLDERKAYNVIEALKENCPDCRKNIPHECCIQPLIKEWEIKARDLRYDKKKNYR